MYMFPKQIPHCKPTTSYLGSSRAVICSRTELFLTRPITPYMPSLWICWRKCSTLPDHMPSPEYKSRARDCAKPNFLHVWTASPQRLQSTIDNQLDPGSLASSCGRAVTYTQNPTIAVVKGDRTSMLSSYPEPEPYHTDINHNEHH